MTATTNNNVRHVCFFWIVDRHSKRPTNTDDLCTIAIAKNKERCILCVCVFQDRRLTSKKTNKIKDDLCMTATTTTTTRGAVVLFWIVLFRQTYKTTHKYRWSVCDCNYKQQEEVCFLRIEDRQTKIKMIIAWLQLQTTRRGVCSSGQRTDEQDQRSRR